MLSQTSRLRCAVSAQRGSVAFVRPTHAQARPVPAVQLSGTRSRATTVVTKALFGLGGAAKSSPTGASAPPSYYICVDCGWIYDGKEDWKKVASSFKCPACSSPKSRFKVYKGTDVKGRPNNAGSSMQKRMAAKQW